ncbi:MULTISPECIES: membrane protein insertase YidC [unclassified Iodidimonas]|jgi:YidC/Oxa1 family membrane protein insertase|uniref:membrane protein insertase YidC n=1 Tax=unclassified Iodidimonas TaxID=2626145 RepID=UPI0024821589|nr:MULTISPECIES: membrane protein insertase YidC [unclassified Iodidimonas]
MKEQKNLLIAMGLTLLVLLAFDYFYATPARDAAPLSTAEQSPQTDPQSAGPNAQESDILPQTPTIAGSTGGGTAGNPGVSALSGNSLSRADALAQSKRLYLETPRLKGSIALTGGFIDDLTLKDYDTDVGKKGSPIVLLNPLKSSDAYYASFGWTARPGLGIDVPDANTVWSTRETMLSPDNPVTLRWTNEQGLEFSRRISVDKDFMFTIEQTVRNPNETPVMMAPYGLISRRGAQMGSQYFVIHEGPLGVLDGSLREIDYKSLREDGPSLYDSVGGWLGLTDKYWLTAIVPEQTVPFKGRFIHSATGSGRYQADYLEEEVVIPSTGEKTVTVRFFAGAKEVDLIERYEKAYDIKLFDRAIDWGWFIFLTKPIFYLLDFLNGLFGSFAVSILVLTVIVKALFFPLANKSYVSMSKMKAVQPKMKALQQRYKDDKPRLQQEMMELYKKEKINPLSGCLPMLAQIPVFFALYKVLFVTIEMRHEPGFFWIKDLSAADPILITNLFGLIPWEPTGFLAVGIWPVIMGFAMFFQMRLNPVAGDPIQQRVMMAMPFVFVFIMAAFPAGLVIYWTWNTLLSAAQQWMIMRRHGVANPAS